MASRRQRGNHPRLLSRHPRAGSGLETFTKTLANGAALEKILKDFVCGNEFRNKFSPKPAVEPAAASTKFPQGYVPSNGAARKSYEARRASGFFEKYMGGEVVVDLVWDRPKTAEFRPVLPHAIAVPLGPSGQDFLSLPFERETADTLFSNNCLEHVAPYREAIREWWRVVKIGGYVICVVPSQQLYEKKRSPPSRFNRDHERFYSPKSLIGEFEESLEENSFRVRHLEENDLGYDYSIGPETHAKGCYEIVLVLQKIKTPGWRLEPLTDAGVS